MYIIFDVFCNNRYLPLFLLSSSRYPATNGLPTPPYDKSTSNRYRSSCFLYLIRSGPLHTSLTGYLPLFLLIYHLFDVFCNFLRFTCDCIFSNLIFGYFFFCFSKNFFGIIFCNDDNAIRVSNNNVTRVDSNTTA